MTDWDRVRRLTLVPFLHDGRYALIPVDRLVLPSGEVLPGEDPLLDACLRIPLETASFRLGFRVAGVTAPGGREGRAVPPTAWVLAARKRS